MGIKLPIYNEPVTISTSKYRVTRAQSANKEDAQRAISHGSKCSVNVSLGGSHLGVTLSGRSSVNRNQGQERQPGGRWVANRQQFEASPLRKDQRTSSKHRYYVLNTVSFKHMG